MGTATDQLTTTMDIWPTLAELAGVQAQPHLPLDGISMVPVLQGSSVERGPVYWSFMDGLAIRDGNWKLVFGEDGDEQPRLFDLAADLAEETSLADQEPERTAEMLQQACAWLQDVEADATPQPSTSR